MILLSVKYTALRVEEDSMVAVRVTQQIDVCGALSASACTKVGIDSSGDTETLLTKTRVNIHGLVRFADHSSTRMALVSEEIIFQLSS